MGKDVLYIAGMHIDLDKVSGVLKNDSKVNHHGKTSTSTYFFTIVLDGQKVELESRTTEERDAQKELLIARLGWSKNEKA